MCVPFSGILGSHKRTRVSLCYINLFPFHLTKLTWKALPFSVRLPRKRAWFAFLIFTIGIQKGGAKNKSLEFPMQPVCGTTPFSSNCLVNSVVPPWMTHLLCFSKSILHFLLAGLIFCLFFLSLLLSHLLVAAQILSLLYFSILYPELLSIVHQPYILKLSTTSVSNLGPWTLLTQTWSFHFWRAGKKHKGTIRHGYKAKGKTHLRSSHTSLRKVFSGPPTQRHQSWGIQIGSPGDTQATSLRSNPAPLPGFPMW